MKKKLFIILILLDLLVITIFIFRKYIFKKIVSVNKISKKELIVNSSSRLQYFYEPLSGYGDDDEQNWWLDYKPNYVINKDSLNTLFEYRLKKTSNVYRIIALGDSNTFGLFVNTEDNWVTKLEYLLNNNLFICKNYNLKFEVINLGFPGYDLEYSAERYRLRGKKYNPDLVIWQFDDNDFEEIAELTIPINEQFHDKKNIEENGLGNNSELIFEEWNKVLHEFNTNYGRDNLLAYQKNILESFITYYKTPILFFDFLDLEKDYEKIVEDLVKKYDNVFFTNRSFTHFNFENHTFQPNDGHPNKEGHKIIAEDLFNYLIKNNIIHCQ